MNAIVEEAHRSESKGRGPRPHGRGGSRWRWARGPIAVEHAFQVSDESLQAMREKGIFLVPTDLTPEACRELIDKTLAPEAERPAELDAFLQEQEEYAPERLCRAIKFGVRMAAGSDMAFKWPGKTRGQASLLMFDAYERAGISPIDMIRMATVNASELLGWEDRIGTVEAGKYADLIAVSGDPLLDIGQLRHVTFVMKSGAVVDLNGRGKILPSQETGMIGGSSTSSSARSATARCRHSGPTRPLAKGLEREATENHRAWRGFMLPCLFLSGQIRVMSTAHPSGFFASARRICGRYRVQSAAWQKPPRSNPNSKWCRLITT